LKSLLKKDMIIIINKDKIFEIIILIMEIKINNR
jgi:hypothetical protein